MDGRLHIDYVEALLGTQIALRGAKIGCRVQFVAQDSLVMQARNSIVAAFLASGDTDLIFIDSDIRWQPQDFLKLISHDVPLVAGVYRRKIEAVDFAMKFADNNKVVRDGETGLIAAAGVGAGFLRIRRDCLERMIGSYPSLRYRPPLISTDRSDRYALFDTTVENNEFVGEDYTFCRRWTAIGGTVWIDPDISLEHIGSAAYSGSLWDSLKASTGNGLFHRSGREHQSPRPQR